jgi:hypothetical protein
MTLFAGADMTERREVLGRLAGLFVLVEGGPRAGHEADVAAAHGAVLLPVGRSGGWAAGLHTRMSRPPAVEAGTWAELGDGQGTPEGTAQAVLCAVRSCLAAAGA